MLKTILMTFLMCFTNFAAAEILIIGLDTPEIDINKMAYFQDLELEDSQLKISAENNHVDKGGQKVTLSFDDEDQTNFSFDTNSKVASSFVVETSDKIIVTLKSNVGSVNLKTAGFNPGTTDYVVTIGKTSIGYTTTAKLAIKITDKE